MIFCAKDCGASAPVKEPVTEVPRFTLVMALVRVNPSGCIQLAASAQIVIVMCVPNARAVRRGVALPEVLGSAHLVVAVGDGGLGARALPAAQPVQASTVLPLGLEKLTPDQAGQEAGAWS